MQAENLVVGKEYAVEANTRTMGTFYGKARYQGVSDVFPGEHVFTITSVDRTRRCTIDYVMGYSYCISLDRISEVPLVAPKVPSISPDVLVKGKEYIISYAPGESDAFTGRGRYIEYNESPEVLQLPIQYIFRVTSVDGKPYSNEIGQCCAVLIGDIKEIPQPIKVRVIKSREQTLPEYNVGAIEQLEL